MRTKNEKLEAELAKTIAKTEQLKNEMAEAKKVEETRHAKDLDDLNKTNQSIGVRVAQLNHPLFQIRVFFISLRLSVLDY